MLLKYYKMQRLTLHHFERIASEYNGLHNGMLTWGQSVDPNEEIRLESPLSLCGCQHHDSWHALLVHIVSGGQQQENLISQ